MKYIKNIKKINIKGCGNIYEGFKYLKNTNILTISFCNIKNILKYLRNVNILNIKGCEITEEDVKYLKNTINFDYCNINYDYIKYLKKINYSLKNCY